MTEQLTEHLTEPDSEPGADRVPTHHDLDLAVAVAESIGYGTVFGKGLPDDPLFPVKVRLTGTDGNIYAVTSLVEKAVKRYLREAGVPRREAAPLHVAIRRELWCAISHDDFLVKVLCLVRAE